jgi:hypothetical protein
MRTRDTWSARQRATTARLAGDGPPFHATGRDTVDVTSVVGVANGDGRHRGSRAGKDHACREGVANHRPLHICFLQPTL